jgi:hypothetical protein
MKEGPWSWWLSRAFLADQPVDVVLLGDSQMNAAVFQADAFTRKRDLDCVVDRQAITLAQDLTAPNASLKAVLNMAMAGGMASDQYLFCKALFPSAPPKLVVLGVGPRCFIDNSLPSASSTEPFQFFSRYVDLGPLTALAFSDQFAAAAWQIRHHLPLLVLHDQCCDLLRNTIQKDVVRITGSLPPTRSVFADRPLKVSGTAANMLHAIYGSAGDAKLGENIIVPVLIPGFYDNTKEYRARYKELDTPTYRIQQQFFESLLGYLNSIGTRVIVVEMPTSPLNQALLPEQFWSQYKNWITQQCTKHGALWADLSNDPAFQKKVFLDTVHLNACGGSLLMHKLATIIDLNSSFRQAASDASASGPSATLPERLHTAVSDQLSHLRPTKNPI